MQTDNSVDAPPDSLRYAKNLFRARAAEPKITVLERIAAVLRVDLAPGRVALGERSASSGQARQMLFESGSSAIDLRVTKTAKNFDIRGQILGGGFEKAAIELRCENETVATVADEMSEFKLTGLPAGNYSLSIVSGDREIFVEKLTLQ